MLENANAYLNSRLFNSAWTSADDPNKESALTISEDIIKGEYGEAITYHSNYYKAVYEQALFLLDNYKRLNLKMQGIESVSISGTSSEKYRDDNIISPIAKRLLNKSGCVVSDL